MANSEKDKESEDTTRMPQSEGASGPDKTAEPDADTGDEDKVAAGTDKDAADRPAESENAVEDDAQGARDRQDLDDTLDEATAAWDQPKPAGRSGPAPAAAPAPKGGGGFVAPLIGGVLAAAIGFGAAQFVHPEGWPFPGAGLGEDATAALASANERLAATQDQISATQDQIAALQSQVSDLAAAQGGGAEALAPELSTLAEQMTTLTDRLGTLDDRVADLAKAQVAAAGEQATEAVTAYEREIAAMREELATQREENARLADSVATVADEAEAEVGAAMSRAAQVEARAALMRIDAALANGMPFDSALGQIKEVEVPEPLSAVAGQGVATLAELQRDFPPAARAALDTALRVEADGGVGDRVNAFMRSQLGLRSLEPREGDDADAVLSRAEAALRDGDLAATLSELDGLPDAAKAEMDAWISAASARVDAIEAARTLEQSLNN